MSDGVEQARPTYAVPPEVWHKAKIAGTVGIVLGVVIIVVAVVAVTAGNADGTIAVAGLLFGLVLAAIGGTALAGAGRVAGLKYALTVLPEALIVDWAGYSTVMRWDDLEYGRLIHQGAGTVYLNVRPRIEFSVPGRSGLRRPALPQADRQHPGELRAFVLSMLDARMSEALAEIKKHLPVRQDG
jgi:hypothetical protein